MSNPTGVDVSHWAPVKDWEALIADGRRFVGIKATQGTGFTDPTLQAHRDGRRAHAADLLGAVFFHYPSEGGAGDPKAEAANFLDAIGELQDDELLALDVEQGKTGRGAPPIDWQREFVSYLPQARDRVPHIYTAKHVWNEIGDPPWPDATVGKVGLWAKQYGPALTKLPRARSA